MKKSIEIFKILILLKCSLFSLLQKDNELDLRVLIHQSLAGCVIGKAGGKIKEIRDVSR